MNDPVIEREFKNLLGERILLRIENCHVKSKRIIVRRMDNNLFWFSLKFAVTVSLLSLLMRCFVFSNIIDSLVLSLLSVTILMVTLNMSPVVEESICILNNLNGFEHEIRHLFGGRKQQFIPTQRLVINEGITMQRVIFYLVAIPRTMQPYVLCDTDVLPHIQETGDDITTTKTVPLFVHILPRLDCLKLIYKHFNHIL